MLGPLGRVWCGWSRQDRLIPPLAPPKRPKPHLSPRPEAHLPRFPTSGATGWPGQGERFSMILAGAPLADTGSLET
ncbi:MAG: hypothetical protein ACK56I_04345, partial [bacterium]